MNPRAAQLFQQLRSVQEIRQPESTGSAHDTICSDVMRIECSVDGGTERYILRTTGNQKLGWMAINFRRNIGDSPMVVVWPSRGADGEYDSVALLQRKALYKVMPTPDPHPPFAAKLSLTDTYVTMENPQMAFTRNTGCRTSFGHSGPRIGGLGCSHITTHHKIGHGMLNVTRIPTIPAEPPVPPPPPVHPGISIPKTKTIG
ncbi:hypothetical protein EDB85DRAFT_236881 [Lactarius pseudohatsudake]|nr:hypothetical protein EDB85DRAFT_236881 [Lactarius pseudohatsudake]